MADQKRDHEYSNFNLHQGDEIGEWRLNEPADNKEETSAELAPRITVDRSMRTADEGEREIATGGSGLGYVAIILSILSLFVLPFLLGASGIILGFVARRGGATSLGNWAIGIGVISIIVGMFILPFFR